jgi:hypothetical protein
MTLAEMNDEFGAARTNKKEFLEKMDRIIPWEEFVELAQPYYYKGERGNKPYPLELMLRIFILQNLYDLADMKVMNEVLDSRAFIVVTHSPILLGYPDTEILSFDNDSIEVINYEDTQSYQITKMFVNDRRHILKHLLEDDEQL